MCLAIAKPNGVAHLPKISHILKGWFRNGDGAGFAYSKKGETEVHYRKGFMSIKDFIMAYETAPFYNDCKDYTIGIHFRMATHGGKSPTLTHPFVIANPIYNPLTYDGADSVVLHNGASVGKPTNKAGYSDTMEYAESVLPLLSKEEIA